MVEYDCKKVLLVKQIDIVNRVIDQLKDYFYINCRSDYDKDNNIRYIDIMCCSKPEKIISIDEYNRLLNCPILLIRVISTYKLKDRKLNKDIKEYWEFDIINKKINRYISNGIEHILLKTILLNSNYNKPEALTSKINENIVININELSLML